ncbi:hypothetical protein Ancab_027699 [Ancistrocladus abbreviatus]
MPSSVAKLCLILLSLLSNLAAVQSDLDDFLRCLPRQYSDPQHPISDAIYLSSNSSFHTVLKSYSRNLRFSTPTTPEPLAIIAALRETHVQATVVCAKYAGLQIRIRSGGHDYEGLSYVSRTPFIILDMFNRGVIDVDIATETVWVQAGATVGQLYYRIAEKSNIHAFPAGVCPTLGIGGHITGGGYGNLLRKYGLSVDNVVDALVVDVNGQILNRDRMGEDLFWAIRGGGAASFAVILAWKINLVHVPENVTVFSVQRKLEQGATEIVYQWQQVAPKIDNGLFIRAVPQVVNGSREGEKTVGVSFVGLYLGQADELLLLMNEKLPALGLQRADCIEMRWVESTLFWYGLPEGTPLEVLLAKIPKSSAYLKRKSDYVKKPIPKEGLELIWKTMIEVENVTMQWNPYGGKMDEILETDAPFPHRAGNLFKVQYLSNWLEDGVEVAESHIRATKVLYDAMTPYVSKDPREAFLNYRDIDVGTNADVHPQFGIRYFKSNFERLVQIKSKVDPGNFFQNEQSIPVHLP